jgi:acetyltransferase-like isoleucine patch superfamily enzyme
VGERLLLGLNARIVNLNAEPSIRIGSDCAICGIIRCEAGCRVEIGDTVYIGDDVIVSAQARVTVEDLTLLAHGVHVSDNDTHPIEPHEREAHFKAIIGIAEPGGYRIAAAPVTIGRGCWVGFNSAILKGSAIGDGAIVAAHAVVTIDVPPLAVVAGNPARVVKMLEPT